MPVFDHADHRPPLAEIQFWNSRSENLECIYDQMKEGDVKKMAIILEQSRSAYFPAFKAMFRNVVSGGSLQTGAVRCGEVLLNLVLPTARRTLANEVVCFERGGVLYHALVQLSVFRSIHRLFID